MSGASPNSTVIFETPEHGVAAWWELMRRYREAGAITVGAIINRYGGGQNYSEYTAFVTKKSGIPPGTEIKLTDNDARLLSFARAMYWYEAGKETPLSNAQIMYGFNLARNKGKGLAAGGAGAVVVGGGVTVQQAVQSGVSWWMIAVIVVITIAVAGLTWAAIMHRPKEVS